MGADVTNSVGLTNIEKVRSKISNRLQEYATCCVFQIIIFKIGILTEFNITCP